MGGATGEVRDELVVALKQLIATACNRPEPPESLDEDAPLLGPASPWGLDSLDVLQISLALSRQYAIRIEDSKEARRALGSVRTLALYLQAAGAA